MFAKLLAGVGEHAQTGAADEFQFRQVKYEVVDGTREDGGELALEFGGGGGVEAAVEFDGGGIWGPFNYDFDRHILRFGF